MTDPAGPPREALLVEDEALVAMVAEEILRCVGFEPFSALNAAEAMKRLENGPPPALAVIDVGLPDMRGDALAAWARQRYPDLPIIVASGYDAADLKKQFAEDPAIAVLGKPYTERDLARTITSLGLEVLEQS